MSGESSQPTDGERLFFAYGSETGNAESIAKRLHHDAVTTHELTGATCMTLNQFVTKKILDEHLTENVATALCLVIVCSTTGEGEPPSNASRFRRWLRSTNGTLQKVRYCVLALGDTNYNSFCAPGIYMDNRLSELGARRCYPRGEADDGVGLDLVVDPWIENIWPVLKKKKGPVGGSAATADGNTADGATAEEKEAAVGKEKYHANEGRVDMAIAQEAAIVYSSASQVCAASALFLYERITELGGKADLYPIEFFDPKTSLTRPPRVLLFLLCTECDANTLCEHCAAQPKQLPPLGPFSAWLCGGDSTVAVPPEATDLPAWLAEPSIRFFNSLLVAPKPESVAQAEMLNARLKAVALQSKLEYLCRRQGSGEVPSIAVSDGDVFAWVEGVLDSLPGVTASTEVIQHTMEFFFDNRVGAAFREALAAESGSTAAGGGTSSYSQKEGGASEHGGIAATASASGRRRRRYCLHHNYTDEAAGGATAAPTHASQPATVKDGTGVVRKTHQVLDDLLTPVVFLYSDKSHPVKQCAMDIFGASGQHHLRSSVCELSNFRQTGFPRRATFVFIVSGMLTKSMARVLKVLRTLQAQGKQVDGVNFAILGVDKSSESDKFNACALELETLLLEMKATKIHCTGLADMDSDSLRPVIQAWESNLWSAIVHPMKSAAYLDMASPNIPAHHSFNTAAAVAGPNSVAASSSFPASGVKNRTAFSPLQGSLRSTSHREGSGTAEDADVFGRLAGTASALSAGAGTFPLPITSVTSPLSASLHSLHGPPGEGHPLAALPTTDGTTASAVTATSAAAFTGITESVFPWDTVPLHKENAERTPVALLYASAGMSKTMAVNALQSAEEKGFPAVVHSFANYRLIDFRAYPNLILFCEAGPDGQSNGGRRLKKFLTNPAHRPDDLSHVRFAVLGLGSTPGSVVHPAFLWAKLLSRLQANRVFPVVIMPSMSQLYSLGVPWTECVLSSMALLPPTLQPPRTRDGSPVSPAAASGGTQPAQLPVDANPASRELVPHADTLPAIADPQRSILFLFGSSTGITESIARDLHREALERGFYSRVAALKYFQKMNFLSTATVVLVCSTIPTAPGGFPRNARSFARYLLTKDQPVTLLNGTAFAVLGVGNGAATTLGPSSYCRTAVRLDRRFAELGGHRLCAVGTVDASQAIAQPVEEWRQAFFAALQDRTVELTAPKQQQQLPIVETPTTTHGNVGGGDGRLASSNANAAAARVSSATPLIAADEAAGVAAYDVTSTASGAATTAAAAVLTGPCGQRPRRAMIAYCCAPTSVVEELANHLALTIAEATPVVPSICTMNDLLKRNWRHEFDLVVFVMGHNAEAEYPLNGSAFARVLRQRTTPLDMFASISYTVLAVSDSNSTQFYMGRQLDRRLEELGGTRVYARGEVVDSFRLERTVEKWSTGLLSLLLSLCDNGVDGDEDEVSENDAEDGTARPGGSHREHHHTRSSAASSEVTAGRLLRRLHRFNDATTTPARRASTSSQYGGRSTQRKSANASDPLHSEREGTTAAATEEQGNHSTSVAALPKVRMAYEDGGEEVQSVPSAEVGSERSSLQDLLTESSMVNRIAYSANNAGDRVDGLVQSWKLLTESSAPYPVLQLDLSVSAETQWAPGQTVAILPSNNASEVEALLRRFRLPYHEPFHPLSIAGAEASSFPTSPLYDGVDFPVSCGTILLRYVDLRVTRSHKTFFQLLEKHSTTDATKAAVQAFFQTLSSERTPRDLVEVLELFPASLPPFRHVVENLTLVQPRQYSICSSHQADATTLSICFKVVEKGLCTNWMYEQCLWASRIHPTASTAAAAAFSAPTQAAEEKAGHRDATAKASFEVLDVQVQPNKTVAANRRVLIPFVIRRASEFRMPRDPLIPMILIGPGTGVAPFRAFLQEREAWLTQRQQQGDLRCPKGQLCGCPYEDVPHTTRSICGSIDLFAGCHRRHEDFLFGGELTQWENDGVLHSLTTAFSREPDEDGFWYGGCYVQDRMQECGVALMDLILQRNAHLFVCGDADRMAKEVHATLLELIQQHLSLPEAAAAAYLDQMSKDGRYLRDVWSIGF